MSSARVEPALPAGESRRLKIAGLALVALRWMLMERRSFDALVLRAAVGTRAAGVIVTP